MRFIPPALVASLLAACGSDPVTSATESDSSAATTQPSSSSTGQQPTSSASDTDTATDVSGTVGMTASGTTTGGTTVEPNTTGGSTSDDSTGTTSPIDPDTGPDDTTATSSTTSSTTADDTSTTADDTSTTSDDTTGMMEEPCACPMLEVPLDDGIFVLSITAELWKFFPMDNSLIPLGAIGCNLPPVTYSMAVDRTGFAWVQYQSGELRKVAVVDPSQCTNPGYQLGQTDITNFGMAFVSNSQFDACDRIYGNTAPGTPESPQVADFFSIDPVTLKVKQIGPTDYGTAEVTGTGDGRAFLFAGANPAKLVEIDKSNGAKLGVTPLPGVELGSAWAFAFFGGDFYFFTNSQGGPGSEVTHLDYDDSDMNGVKDIKKVVADAPISIVGAGVSTCAPTAPQ